MQPTLLAAALPLASILIVAAPAFAQGAEAPTGEAVLLTPVVVTATRYGVAMTDAPTPVDVISRPQIERRNAYRLGDVLSEVPGLTLRGSAFGESFPASGAGSISLRGVPRTPRTLVLIDGHPLNNALSGAVNLSSISLDEVDRIEVVHGPYSAQYGGHAMGGVIQIFTTAPKARSVRVKIGVGGGAIDQWGASVVWRDRLANGLAWSLTAGTRRSRGWDGSDEVVSVPTSGPGALAVFGATPSHTPGDRFAYRIGTRGARPWNQVNAGVTAYYDLGARTQLATGVVYSKYHTRFSAPETSLTDAAGQPVFSGNLTVDGGAKHIVVAEADFLTQTPSSERDTRTFARLEHTMADGHFVKASVSFLDHGFQFPTPGAGARYSSGPGDYADQPNTRLDVDVTGHFLLSEQLSLTVGASANRNRLHRSTYAVSYWRDIDTRTSVKSESFGKTVNQAAYGELQWKPIDRVVIYGGLRHDRFDTEGRVVQNTAPLFDTRYAKRGADHTSPKLALVYEPSATLTLRASFGTGFRAPSLLDLYTRSTTPASLAGQYIITEPAPGLRPERVKAWELGADWSKGRSRARVAVYTQTLTDLFYRKPVNPLLNQVTNAGEAKIDGVEGSFSAPLPWDGLRAFGAMSHQFRYTITKNAAQPASVGKRVTDVPRDTASLGVEGGWDRWSIYAALRGVSHAFGSGDDLNANTRQGVYGSWDGYAVADVKLTRKLAGGVTASISANNILNHDYFAFYHQPGRSIYVELQAKY